MHGKNLKLLPNNLPEYIERTNDIKVGTKDWKRHAS